ncbi:hypothetical protein GV793_19660, partial [Nocardia cyriacigeorgica]|nr:hypothetical protein [Nocardia cyriacigeorgica]
MRAPTTRQRLAAIAGRVLTTVLAVLATLLFSYLLLHATGPTPSPVAPPAHCLGRIPVGAEQVGAEMVDRALLLAAAQH